MPALYLLPDNYASKATQSFWQSFVEACRFGGTEFAYAAPPLFLPTNRELYEAEAGIISRMAQAQSAVIVGRGGLHALRAHPRHLSVFLFADQEYRRRRLENQYQLSPEKAAAAIAASDQERARYRRMVNGKDWTDARQYHLCLDTGVLELPTAIDTVLAVVQARFL